MNEIVLKKSFNFFFGGGGGQCRNYLNDLGVCFFLQVGR